MNILEAYKEISKIVDGVRSNSSKSNRELAKTKISEILVEAEKNELNLNVSVDIIDKISQFNDYEEQHSYESSFDEDDDFNG